MEHHVRKPEPMPDKLPKDKTWQLWRQEFEIFLKAGNFVDKKSEDKANLLMNLIGKVGLLALQDIDFDNEEEKQNYDILIQKFNDYFDPPKKEIEERYKFYSRSKKNNETIEKYIADLKEKAKTCNFGDLTESLVRDMVILDIKDKPLRELLFREKSLNLEKLIMIYNKHELNTQQMKKEVTKKLEETKKPSTENVGSKPKVSVCWRCGISHPPKSCPAFRNECEKCKEKGHFTARCNSKAKSGSAGATACNNVLSNPNVSFTFYFHCAF